MLLTSLTKLEKILNEKGIKQTWLAKKIGKTPPELNRWVKGKITLNGKINSIPNGHENSIV